MTPQMELTWLATVVAALLLGRLIGWRAHKHSRAAGRALEAARVKGYDEGLMTDQSQAVEDAWMAGRDWAFARAREQGTEHRHRRSHWWNGKPARLADDDDGFDWDGERPTEHVPRHGSGSVTVVHHNGLGGQGSQFAAGGGAGGGGASTFELPRQPYQPSTGTYGHEPVIDRAALAELAAGPQREDLAAAPVHDDDSGERPRIHERVEPPSLISIGVYAELAEAIAEADAADGIEPAQLVEPPAQVVVVEPGDDVVEAVIHAADCASGTCQGECDQVVEVAPAVPVFRSSPASAAEIAVDPAQCQPAGGRWPMPHEHDDDGWCPVDGVPTVCEETRDDLVPISATDGLTVGMSQRAFELTLHGWSARVMAEGADRASRMLGDIEGGGWRDDQYPARPAVTAPKRLALPAASGRV